MKKIVSLISFFLVALGTYAQMTLTLEDCRSMAIQNNKALEAARVNRTVAEENLLAARTKYLPRVNAMAGYEHFNREVSLLNHDTKSALSSLGTTLSTSGRGLSDFVSGLVEQGFVSPEMAQYLSQQFQGVSSKVEMGGNELGKAVKDAFRTDTRNMFAASVMLTQPIYTGGQITAANRIADIQSFMAYNQYDRLLQNTLYDIDANYWLVISLHQKRKLAESYLQLVTKLNVDVHKMIEQGVATRADGLNSEVRMNEAEMSLMKVEDALELSKMVLCQLIGIPLGTHIILADENNDLSAVFDELNEVNTEADRPELRLLYNTIKLREQQETLVTAEFYRPKVMLTGGYLMSNPSAFNGFEKKFKGMWNVGVAVTMPILNWGEGKHKRNAALAMRRMAIYDRDEVQEKIDLQVRQQQFKVKEAARRLEIAKHHIISAEENLRCASLGFHEGVMSLTDVLAAQTAWESAQTEKIEADIDVRLSQLGLRKAAGQVGR